MTKFKTAKALTALYLITALALSFTHIAALFALMGAGWEAWIAPVMIDAVAVIGKISMGDEFSAKTRRQGRTAFLIAGSISLVANVTIGYVHQQYGSAVLGAIVVFGALWAEGHLHTLKPKAVRGPRTPKPAAAPATPAAAPAAKDPAKVAAARKAAATRAARKAAATPITHPLAHVLPTNDRMPVDTRAYI